MEQTREHKRVYAAVKRLLDLVLSLLALCALAPVFLVIILAIRLDSKGPAFFLQTRVGKGGRCFTIYKFRSMCVGAEKMQHALWDRNERDGPVFKIKNDPRTTRVGVLLRRTNMDELPQLLNVMRGEMSLVGPRPPLPSEVAQYTPRIWQRLSVPPGLTCFWQIAGCETSFAEWMEMDLRYLRERGLWLDIRIIVWTFPVLWEAWSCPDAEIVPVVLRQGECEAVLVAEQDIGGCSPVSSR